MHSENIKASLEVRDDGLDPTSPFLKPCLHVHAGQVLKRSDDPVKYDVYDPPVLRQAICHVIYLLRFRKKHLIHSSKSPRPVVCVPKRGQCNKGSFGLIDDGSKQFQLLFEGFLPLLTRLRVVDLAVMFLGLFLVPPTRNHSAGLVTELFQNAIKRPEAIPYQRVLLVG